MSAARVGVELLDRFSRISFRAAVFGVDFAGESVREEQKEQEKSRERDLFIKRRVASLKLNKRENSRERE